jgi:flagellar FliL protein
MAEEEKTEKKSKNKLMFILVPLALLLLVAVGVAAYLLGARTAGQAPAVTEQTEEEKTGTAIGPMVDVNDFIINILDKNETRYLKAALTLEVENAETLQEVTERMPQVRDAILLLIGNKTFAELSDLQGKLQLRAEIIVRLNRMLTKGKVKGIYFTEFVVQ